MSRLRKTVLISTYTALLLQLIKLLLMDRRVEIVEIEYIFQSKPSLLGHELLKYKKVAAVVSMEFEKPERLQTDYKYVLKWTSGSYHYNAPVFVSGQRLFIENNCTHTNCYMTNEKTILADLRYFDAILFDVENNWDLHPSLRSQYQHYIFLASESAANFPICSKYSENYYNLTWTYKLNSDIRWSYITVLHKNGTIAGPKIDMHWVEPMLPISDKVRRVIQGKNKTAAWFVSSCQTRSNRQNVTDHIKEALLQYGMAVDVYGWCGPLRCPRDRLEDCLELLEKEYYFYLAFENSLAEDYVTEKIMHPLLHYTVPIVYGGANYSRFLPPGSYIDAGAMDANTVALKMYEAIRHRGIYENYFRWHNHYTYKETPEATDICTLCKILNAPPTFSAKRDFRKWWNINDTICEQLPQKLTTEREDDAL